MRDLFIDTLRQRAAVDRSIFLITADLGFKVFDRYREELPAQFLNIGIAEQNMIGVATGMALSGRIVFVYSIANFPSLRCLEQIRNDACYHDANVKIVSVGSGLSYGQLGISHHATEDISIMRALPNMTVLSPGDNREVIACTHQAIDKAGTFYLRLDREGSDVVGKPDEKIDVDKIRIVKKGNTTALLSTGGMLKVALQVADKLNSLSIDTTVASVANLSSLDIETLKQLAQDHSYLFTLEEHSVNGGLGGLVAENMLELGRQLPIFHRFGLRGGFSSIVGDQEYLRQVYGIDAESIVKKIASLISEQRASKA
jgi:transketolase